MHPVLKPDDAIDVMALRCILVIKLRHHGDVLLSGPVLSALKAAAPHTEIDALVYKDTRDMIELHPAMSQLHLIDRQWKKLGPVGQLRAEWQLIRTLKSRQYDLVVHLTEHNRGAWLIRLLKPRWSVGMEGDFGRFFAKTFTHRYPVIAGNRRHTVEIHLDALRRLGIQPDPRTRLTMMPGAPAEQHVAELLATHGVQAGRYIVVHPGSRWLFKCWPVEQTVAVCRQLQADGHTLVLTGAPDPAEAGMVNAVIAGLSQPVVNLQGQLTLKQLGAVIASARMLFGVDSAPMHMAAALGTPVVALFGPSGEIEWAPWQVKHRIITSDHPCRPCGRDGCGGGKVSDCLVQIGSQRVYAAIQDLLAECA
ncbi:putative lipopolysaccharide heptosyltransferase III [Burkholderiaceae bacterium DAT-1]|nr:putative lipopolysaccharide heptosyltransferase III [Burkholderiaceae bacterium DAT-1]